MAETATLARPYASAAFDLAKGADRLGEWSTMLGLLAEIAQTEPVRALVSAPALADEVKAHRLAALAEGDLDERCRRFLLVLAENKRLDLLAEISAQFDVMKAETERVVEVEVAAAVTLTEAQLAAYAEALRRRFDRQVEVTATVDASLVGGAVIRAGDTVIDGSVRGRLTRLMDSLTRA